MKPALKICIQQGQVIIYRNFTTRKGTFLFKESFKACFIRVTSRNSKPPGEMCTVAEQNLIEKQSTQNHIFFSLGVKPALKICIQQGQVIIYRNITTRKGTFLFKESFKACFIRVTFRNSKPPGEMCTVAEQNLIEKQSTQNHIFFSLGVKPALKICIQQGQVIIYRNVTTRKGTFLFKENFKACFIRVTSRNSKPPGEMCTVAEQNFD